MQTGIPSSLILGSPAGTAQRLADSLTFARAGTPEGTVVIEARIAAGYEAGRTQCLFEWTDAPRNNVIEVRRINGNLRAEVRAGGGSTVPLVLGRPSDGSDVKVALTVKDGAYAVSLNGAPALSAVLAGVPVGLDMIIAGNRRTGNAEWYGTIARMALFDRAYDPSQLPEVWA